MAASVTSQDSASKGSIFTVLVTGANSGLGYATCQRLIDEFLFSRPSSQTLNLLFSTRDRKKGDATLKNLIAHLRRAVRDAGPGVSEERVRIEGVLVDLTKLVTVKTLAAQLIKEGRRLDAVVCNAGIAGWVGIDYPQAIRDFLGNIIDATTCPKFMICDIGAVCPSQLPAIRSETTGDKDKQDNEPPLGQVFAANVLGHYMLVHWLLPALTPSTRIIWVSSTSATPETFTLSDPQCLLSPMAYESSKRLTDLLVLTSSLPSTRHHTTAFLGPNPPTMIITHPGVIATPIVDLNPLIRLLMLLATYLARLLGSPWHPISPYKGAVAAVWAVLSPPEQLVEMEEREGKAKWGSACDVFGRERVARTEVYGWGMGGKAGGSGVPVGKRWARTEEGRVDFEVLGGRVWTEMEGLRGMWERRLEGVGGDV